MGVTSIAWTDRSVNPIRARLHGHIGHHCEKVSAGCANCYSSRIQSRFTMPEFRADRRQGVEVFFDDARLREVLTRRTPTMWFWCDMTDLFGDWVEEAWIDKVFAVCALTPQHTHQILTKRPERMRAYMEARAHRAMFWKDAARSLGYALEWEGISLVPFPLPNVWLGVSVEDQATADQRVAAVAALADAARRRHADRVRCHLGSRGEVRSGRPALMRCSCTTCGLYSLLRFRLSMAPGEPKGHREPVHNDHNAPAASDATGRTAERASPGRPQGRQPRRVAR